jgi:hypothetical protein
MSFAKDPETIELPDGVAFPPGDLLTQRPLLFLPPNSLFMRDIALGRIYASSLIADLIYSDEPPLESYLHLQQMILLLTCLEWWWRDRQDFFAAGNLTVYYSPRQRKSEHFRGPDFFVVLGTERKPRKSWVVWE